MQKIMKSLFGKSKQIRRNNIEITLFGKSMKLTALTLSSDRYYPRYAKFIKEADASLKVEGPNTGKTM